MKNRIITISFREIKKSFKRFLSLFIMSFLGVAVFVGMKSSAKVMLVSLDKYYDDNEVFDIKVVSTLGLTDEDVIELKKLDLIEEAYGIHSKDVLFYNNDTSYVISLSEINDYTNTIIVNLGRAPRNSREIIVEDYLLETTGLKIGDSIVIDDPDGVIKNKEFKIVGTVISPLHMLVGSPALSRGTSPLGVGTVNFYAYVTDEAFEMDYYSEIYLKVKGAKDLYTSEDDYNSLIGYAKSEVEIIKQYRQKARYEEIYNQVMKEISEQENLANKQINEANEKLLSYKTQLDDGLKYLNANKNKVENGKRDLENSLIQLNNAKSLIDQNEIVLNNSKNELINAKNEINNKLSSYGLTYDDVLLMMDLLSGKEVTRERFKFLVDPYNKYKEEIYNAIDYLYDHCFITDINNYINTGLVKYKNAIINALPKDLDHYDEIVNFINSINVNLVKNMILQDILSNRVVYELKSYIPTWVLHYDKIIEYLDKYANSVDNIRLLFESIRKIEEGEKQIASGELELAKAKQEYEIGYQTYLEYYNQIKDGEKELQNGYNTYFSNLNTYNANLFDFNNKKIEIEKKISEAKKDINSLEIPTWYVTTRMDNSDYFNYTNVDESLIKLSNAFPTIFFIVAVFMSVMSMSRMALEDRSEIGALKALGFSNTHIMTKYFIYASLATLIGGILGSIFGFYFLTYFIWRMYRILFTVLEFKYYYNYVPFIVGILAAYVCITGTALLTVRGMVKEKTSDLLRPKAPPMGKNIFLEKLPLWNRISFSNKVTIRNVFRYKKRVIMTVLGITGCTILLITGYGIRDSITNISKKQYSDIMTFDNMIFLDNTEFDLDELFNNEKIKDKVYLDLMQANVGINSVNVSSFDDVENMKHVFHLKSKKTGKEITLVDDKVIISEKLAELEGLKIGDKIKIIDYDKNEYEIEISDICVNYIGNHVYMNKYTYEKYIGKYINNAVYLNFDNPNNNNEVIDNISNNEHVLVVSNLENSKANINSMLKSLDSIVYLLIVFSGILSFVVLYNLSYINISERKREISSLKVLGFYNSEVDNYIIKENIIITLIGIGLGILLGKPFVDYIVSSIEVDLVRFVHIIDLFSYVKTIMFMLLFTIIVSIIIHFTLKRINMIESLKSVE